MGVRHSIFELNRIYSNRGTQCQDQILVLFVYIGTSDSDNDSVHKQNLDYVPMSKYSTPFLSPKNFHTRY